ncbi:MAG: hypothetical protein MUC94_17110, partial [bacterium]|nr:hypothetical protein [bacterium]
DALPNASFIGFTGTPIEKADRSTPAVFGKYVDVYDVEQAVKDRRKGGFGLHIIRRSVEMINYISDPRHGNRLILVKAINVNKSL